MRSTKLTAAIAAASTLLALAPAGALAAHRHPRAEGPLTGCRITELAEPHLVTTGETAQIFGVLTCGGVPAEGQTLTVFERPAGLGFKMVGTATSGAGGAYSFTSSPIVDDSAFYVSVPGARSRNRLVRVAPQVTLLGPAEGSQLKTGFANAVGFAGLVSPADSGATVYLQREASTSFEEWVTIQEGSVRPGGSYALKHVFRVPGDANLRVIIRPHGKFDVRGVSNTLSYEISQAQNPRLTIFSSADPVGYGLPLTISGVLAGGANQKVTLSGRTFPVLGGPGFVKVQETTTNGSGEYQFVIAAAAQSTSYRVTQNTGTAHSAVLFEGVKYALTAGVSGSTVQAGQSLTFSGAVTPARAGKPVYLERQNLIGSGFHIVDLTSVGPTGSYSITHFMFGSGKQVYRVRVPGDPDNQAVSSPTFPIEVTPAPVGSLRPVSQGTLPH